jgi:hypothetical protein
VRGEVKKEIFCMTLHHWICDVHALDVCDVFRFKMFRERKLLGCGEWLQTLKIVSYCIEFCSESPVSRDTLKNRWRYLHVFRIACDDVQ